MLFARVDKIELVDKYFSDKEITNEIILTKNQKLKKSLSKLEQEEGNEKNIKIANETKNTNAPEAETPHLLKNGEIIIKGVFKKKLNDKIVKDVKHVKGWNIADIDVTY
ncbi:Hypothetical predicted protein [Mytilus galloprovincialis]|uniref:Uncharacterized protein n=1 Tax=Mytilus galloprovincialis TaxID=29158 RepID=A0A8B6HE31_MYTGA|nr:Hypothetical predicted protein [Mytilus galloprovincialis]